MKNVIIRLLKFIIDKVKRNRFIQNVFESPFDLKKFDTLGFYEDSLGNKHLLYKGLRTKIVPSWERMLTNQKRSVSDVNFDQLRTNSFITLNKLESVLNSYGKSITNSEILEIGCHSGSVSMALAEKGAKRVIGSEFNGYKVGSISEKSAQDKTKLNEVDEYLKEVRNELAKKYSLNGKVEFIDDDICHSALSPQSFDIICSWEVLEHLHDTEKAFKSISELLKVGGISIHHYNPFFCLNGGHSLCTLDFLWGHARLSEEDFLDYVNNLRPNEIEKAISFYKKGLNRMSLSDLDCALEKSGMKTLAIIPFTKEQHLRMVSEEALNQVKQLYPSITIQDLIAPAVLVISQKTP